MTGAILDWVLKHWKGVIVSAIGLGGVAYGFMQHVEIAYYRNRAIKAESSISSLKAAESDANTKAKAEQKQADAESLKAAQDAAAQARAHSESLAMELAAAEQSAAVSDADAKQTKLDYQRLLASSKAAKSWDEEQLPAALVKQIGEWK